VADAGHEGGGHPAHPLQAEEIKPADGGDAAALDRRAVAIEDGDIDPAEINAIAGCPDDCVDALGAEIEPADRVGHAEWGRQYGPGGGLFGKIEAAVARVLVGHLKEGRIIEVGLRETVAKAGTDIEHAAARGDDAPDERDAFFGEAAEIDGVAA